MTVQDYCRLCAFAYIDLPDDMLQRGRTLYSISKELLARSRRKMLVCGELSKEEAETLEAICRSEETARLTLIDFVNRNSGTGFAAYAFRAADGSVQGIFRGSEGRGCGVPTSIDWIDNFLAPFHGSVQYADIAAFAARFEGERVVFSGHSKGAHNALYALAQTKNPDAQAVVFNGQGFSLGQMEAGAGKRLARSAVNYVTRGDLVGVLLHHPERRVFVRRKAGENAHALSSFSFDERGDVIPAMRPLWSLAVEWGSRRLAAAQ